MAFLETQFGLGGKTAVITGGGGTLCSAIAGGFAQAGANVILWDIRPEAMQEKAAAIGKACGEEKRVACVAVNLMDEARRKGLEVDTRSLARDLGVPCVPVTARTGEGISTLLQTVAGVVDGSIATQPKRVQGTSEFQRAVSELLPMIEAMIPGIANARWLAIRLLDGDAKVQNALLNGELPELMAKQRRAQVQFSQKMAVSGRQ